jgi:hypothetical protein
VQRAARPGQAAGVGDGGDELKVSKLQAHG